ncbi:MAG TPA: ABC transporter ATP-binding protein, partial [Chloroflexota bacterium]
RRFSRLGVIQGRREHRAAQEMVERLRIATPHLGFRVGNLSGGNKQKVAFGKWLMACERPEGMVFLFDEPTEGVDVGTKAEMWAIIRGLARDGAGVVVASSELDELFHLSDRIYVLRAGRVVACVRTSETTQDDLLHMMLVEHEPPETRRAAVERQPSTRPSL